MRSSSASRCSESAGRWSWRDPPLDRLQYDTSTATSEMLAKPSSGCRWPMSDADPGMLRWASSMPTVAQKGPGGTCSRAISSRCQLHGLRVEATLDAFGRQARLVLLAGDPQPVDMSDAGRRYDAHRPRRAVGVWLVLILLMGHRAGRPDAKRRLEVALIPRQGLQMEDHAHPIQAQLRIKHSRRDRPRRDHAAEPIAFRMIDRALTQAAPLIHLEACQPSTSFGSTPGATRRSPRQLMRLSVSSPLPGRSCGSQGLTQAVVPAARPCTSSVSVAPFNVMAAAIDSETRRNTDGVVTGPRHLQALHHAEAMQRTGVRVARIGVETLLLDEVVLEQQLAMPVRWLACDDSCRFCTATILLRRAAFGPFGGKPAATLRHADGSPVLAIPRVRVRHSNS